jgi:hypothetical protein
MPATFIEACPICFTWHHCSVHGLAVPSPNPDTYLFSARIDFFDHRWARTIGTVTDQLHMNQITNRPPMGLSHWDHDFLACFRRPHSHRSDRTSLSGTVFHWQCGSCSVVLPWGRAPPESEQSTFSRIGCLMDPHRRIRRKGHVVAKSRWPSD